MGPGIFFYLWLCCFDYSPQRALFAASTPCSEGTRPVPGIPREGGCELIKWELRFSDGSYTLDCNYGIPKQGTRGFIGGGKRLHREGRWKREGNKVVLDPDRPAESISFLRLNENLLHLLDSSGRLMVGNGGWSYTLNRIQP